MTTSPFNPELNRIDEEAADWFARRRSGEMTAVEAAELEQWLVRQEHGRAFELAEQMWSELEAIRSDPRMISLRERGQARRRPLIRLWLGPALAAGLAIASLGGWAFVHRPDRTVAAPVRQEFRTSVGQRTTVTLSDGSVVTLDTDTVLRTIESGRERRVELKKGRAFFQVAQDASRPFVVAAGDRAITATGTAFGVDVARKELEVILVEGKVRVDKLAAAGGGKTRIIHVANVSAGSRLSMGDGDRWSVSEVDVPRETSWLNGQLTYDGERLGKVVADMNRYSDKKIFLLDDALAERPLSGVYKAGDTEEFVRILKAYHLAEVRSNNESRVDLVAAENSLSSRE